MLFLVVLAAFLPLSFTEDVVQDIGSIQAPGFFPAKQGEKAGKGLLAESLDNATMVNGTMVVDTIQPRSGDNSTTNASTELDVAPSEESVQKPYDGEDPMNNHTKSDGRTDFQGVNKLNTDTNLSTFFPKVKHGKRRLGEEDAVDQQGDLGQVLKEEATRDHVYSSSAWSNNWPHNQPQSIPFPRELPPQQPGGYPYMTNWGSETRHTQPQQPQFINQVSQQVTQNFDAGDKVGQKKIHWDVYDENDERRFDEQKPITGWGTKSVGDKAIVHAGPQATQKSIPENHGAKKPTMPITHVVYPGWYADSPANSWMFTQQRIPGIVNHGHKAWVPQYYVYPLPQPEMTLSNAPESWINRDASHYRPMPNTGAGPMTYSYDIGTVKVLNAKKVKGQGQVRVQPHQYHFQPHQYHTKSQ